MARNKISLFDRAVVKARLAAGFSHRQAIEGTKIKSHRTVGRIAKEEQPDIAQMRSDFVLMIEGLGGDQEKQAQQLAKMVTAQKPYGKNAIMKDDWKSQLDAIKFILELRGVIEPKGGGATVNILNDQKFIGKYMQDKK